jgi:hypothetical protein
MTQGAYIQSKSDREAPRPWPRSAKARAILFLSSVVQGAVGAGRHGPLVVVAAAAQVGPSLFTCLLHRAMTASKAETRARPLAAERRPPSRAHGWRGVEVDVCRHSRWAEAREETSGGALSQLTTHSGADCTADAE